MPHLTSRAAVGQDAAGAHVLAAAEDLDALRLDGLVSQVLDVGALGEEAAVEHEDRGGAERVTRAPDAASCRLFCWHQALCSAKGGAAEALLLHESGEGAEWERSGSGGGEGVREVRERGWCSGQMAALW